MSACHPESQFPNDPWVWSQRYKEAISRYDRIDLYSQEAVAAVREGIAGWLQLLPQRGTQSDGSPAPVNAWGLGAEKCVLQCIRSQLTARGQAPLAECMWSQLLDLLGVAKALDASYLETPTDPHAEGRLLGTAKVQANGLLKLLATIRLDGSPPAPATSMRPRGPGAPPRRDSSQDRKMVEEWEAARGKAGMTRKEFCQVKRISLDQLIQAMDRVRKQRAQRKPRRA